MQLTRHIVRKNIWPLINFVGLPLLLVFGTLGYIESEARTALFSETFGDLNVLCQSQNTSLKYYKITYFNKAQGKAEIQCIYEDTDSNAELILNKRATDTAWQVVVTNKLNENKNLYWPVYR